MPPPNSFIQCCARTLLRKKASAPQTSQSTARALLGRMIYMVSLVYTYTYIDIYTLYNTTLPGRLTRLIHVYHLCQKVNILSF